MRYNLSLARGFPYLGLRSAGVSAWKTEMPGLLIVQEKAETALVLHVQGRLTIEDLKGLKHTLEQAWRLTVPRIILDLSGCDYVDSSGIAVLVEALNRSRKEKKVFLLAAPGPQVQSILQLTRLDKVFQVFPSVQNALTA